VSAVWCGLVAIAALHGQWLDTAWPAWSRAFWAVAVWGLSALLLRYGIGRPFNIGRLPVLSTAFALLMTLFGSGSYWATVQLYPGYRVEIELAALLVAVCTGISLVSAIGVLRLAREGGEPRGEGFVWNWSRLSIVTYLLFLLAAVGTVVAVRRIGYIPILAGDPESLRVEFPSIGGIWYRFSMLGVVVALLVGIQVCARRAQAALWTTGLASLAMVSLYGPRFFVALPLGATLLLWGQVRSPIRLRLVTVAVLLGVPLLSLLYFVRQQDWTPLAALGPVGLILYGTLGEFRDLGWALQHYSDPARLLHGATLGSLIVPLLPRFAWTLLGIDKDAIFARNSATILADEMGRETGQRVGLYGECYMNFGWAGAIGGALLYGLLLGYLDRQFRRVRGAEGVAGVLIALAAAATIFAQIGQLNMFTATVTAFGYPLLLVTLVAARRTRSQA